MKSLRLKPCAAAVAFATLYMANPALAATCTLTANGLWQTPGDWSCAARPGSGDSATINIGGLVTTNQAEQITTLTNAGTINIDASTLTLLGGGTTNTGIINVGGPSTAALQVQSSLNNAGGTINVRDGSVLNQVGTTLSGGTINTVGAGRIAATNDGNNFLIGVTLNGTLDLATSTSIERIASGMTLNGTVNVNANSLLAFQGDQTVGGSGTIVLGSSGSSNRVNLEAGNLVLGPGITIRGENGTIGQQSFIGGASTLTNNGRIAADVAGGTVSLNVNGLVTNNGILEAKSGGTLVLNSNIAGSPTSSINVGAGSLVLQNGVSLSGAINTSGTGSFRASNSGGNFIDGVKLTGNLDLADATGIERVTNGLTLTSGSTININNNSILALQGNQTLGGTGTVIFGNTGASNRLNVEAGDLTIGSGIVVRGENGTIGRQAFVGGASTLTNNGRISADVALGTVTIAVSGTVTNNGVLEAQNGGTLILNNSIIGASGSHIDVGAGSTILQNGVTLQGVINSAGGGSLRASDSGSNFFDAVTLTGNLDLATATAIERIKNNFTLNGTINVNANSVLAFEGNQAISGTGTIVLGNTSGSNRVNLEAGNLVLGPGITIRGENGTIGQQAFVGGASTLTNNGRISADVAAGNINLSVSGTTNNNGVLEARNGGTLTLSSTVANGAAGQINAVGGSSRVVQNGVVISGGEIGGSGGGALVATNSGNNYLSNVNVSGTVDLASAIGIERVIGGLTLSGGTIKIDSSSLLAFQGDQAVGGTGDMVLGTTGSGNRINLEAGNLTLGSGITIHGRNGTIGQQTFIGGAANLTNNGIVSADVGGGTIALGITGALVNNGTFGAANGGTLNVSNPFTGTGDVRTASAGTFALVGSGLSSTTGRLINDGNLSLGTNNLTVSADYSNANFGTGNSFSKRSNVTGTGQILAAGDATQRITGATVTNGATGTPTLTIGNVHVGSTTYNYQVANAGTTGPAIRGAIQTGVNGGNITDARLSGSGVTAGNYGPVAAGSNSGNLAVTYTAGTAGSLAPLSGQTVHIANNFDNLAEQTLNIVTGAGAAAYNLASATVTPTPIVFANAHVGDTRTQVITVANTGPAGSFTEKLDARFGANTGNVTNNGGTVALLAPSSSSTALSVGLNTSAAGARSGSAVVNLTSDGTGTSGLGNTALGSQTVAVSGNVYNLALSSTIGTVSFGVRHVGDGTITQTVAVTNTAAAGLFSEGLDTSFGTVSGTGASRISTSGSVTNLTAGSTSSSALQVHLDTSTVGTVNGTIRVIQASNGTISGLGNTALPDQNPAVTADVQGSGTVVRYASPLINTTTPVNFGAVRVGSTQSRALSITNNVPNDGFSESLIAGIAGTTGATVGSGGFGPPTAVASLTASATDATHLLVGLNTGAAGHQTGNVSVNFKSDGTSFSGGTITDLGNTAVGVQGDVYRLANPTATPSTVTVAGRVGSVAPTTAITLTNASPDLYTEGLSVSRGATSAGFTSSGSIVNLAAGGTSGAIGVTLNTAAAGTFSGTQALDYVSTGAGTTGAADLAIGAGTVTLNGKVYTPAVATVNTPAVAFGIVHVGDTVAQHNVSVTNAASITTLNDVLVAAAISASGPFTASGNLGTGLAAQTTSTSALKVGFDTTTAGTFSGSASFSAASHDADLSDAALASLAISLTGTVNNYAADAFSLSSGAGTLSRSGSTFILDYGTVTQGTGTRTTTLAAANTATGPADLLDGNFQFLDALDFAETGFASFLDLAAGAADGPLTLSFASMTLGSFTDTIVLHGVGHNASGYAAAIGDLQLIVRGNVIAAGVPPTSGVPEPDSLLLLGLGIPLLFLRRGRKTTTPTL